MKQKYFTENQLKLLPDMGYYVELPGEYRKEGTFFISINNGSVKYYNIDVVFDVFIWESLMWNCGPTKNNITKYLYFKTYGEFSKAYPNIPKAPNDFPSTENGKSRVVTEKTFELPDGFSYGYYHVVGVGYGLDTIVYFSKKKIYCSLSFAKTIGQMIFLLTQYKSSTTFYKTYDLMKEAHPEITTMRTFKTKPSFDNSL